MANSTVTLDDCVAERKKCKNYAKVLDKMKRGGGMMILHFL